MLNSWFYCSHFILTEEVCHTLWVFPFLREKGHKDFGTFLFKLVKQKWGRYISDVRPAGSFIVMAAELAHGPGMTTFLFRAGMLPGELHLQDPHASSTMSRNWTLQGAEDQLSCAHSLAHTAEGGWQLGLAVQQLSCQQQQHPPTKAAGAFQCSSLWVSPPCWLWRWGKHLWASLLAAIALLTAVLQRMLMPVLPLSQGVRQIRFLFSSLPTPCINLVGFNLIASFSDRLSQEQCKWALKCGDLVYICQLIAWVAQTSRAGTCLLVLRSIFDFRPDAACRSWDPTEEDVLFGQCLALGESDLKSLGWVSFTLITEAVAQCKAAWICSLLGELTQASPSEVPAFLPICLALLCDHMHL